jgi:hypothetical protein
MRIESTGNVGIGTTSPTEKLHVVGGDVKFASNTYVGGIINAYQGDASIWVPNVGQAFTIKQNTGNVGIGTTSPTASLHIVKSTVNDALLITTPNNNSSLYPFFLGGATLTSDNYLRANSTIIEFSRNGVASTIRTVGSSNNLTLQSANNLIFNTNGANEYARIDTNGNVGIGTSTPAAKLDVRGNVRIETNASTELDLYGSGGNILRVSSSATTPFIGTLTNAPLGFFTSATERARVSSNGNLLVGTTADQGYRVQITGSGDNMLNVWGATAPSIRLDNAASGATQRFVLGLATATNNFIQGASAGDVCITTATASPIVFGMWQTSTASEVMRITTSNNLLINKTADGGQKLQVSGKVNFASLPTSSAGLSAGDIWNNGGVLNIV